MLASFVQAIAIGYPNAANAPGQRGARVPRYGKSRLLEPDRSPEEPAADCHSGQGGRHAAPRLPVDAAHAEVFDLEEFLDAVFRAFAADGAFSHAAEGRDLGRDDALVDADDAVFERLGDAPDAADVAAVEIGCEPPPFPPPPAGEG